MQRFHDLLSEGVRRFLADKGVTDVRPIIQYTRPDFEGDLTVVVFPLAKALRQRPDAVGAVLGEWLVQTVPAVERYEVVKGFVNISFSAEAWRRFLLEALPAAGFFPRAERAERIVIEYSSPNTNKPQHLGHIRNNLLGWSVAAILQRYGHEVYKVNLINDRGIHIAQSMVAWMQFGGGATPESTGKKGDHFVGDYYVRFAKAHKQQQAEGGSEETPIMQAARAVLRRWEAGDLHIRPVWLKMNSWVLDGFAETYGRMGVDFDKTYFESETYLVGKQHVMEGLRQGLFHRKEDGSIWADLTAEGLDQKLLLRSDGTTVYITQDIGTAALRYFDFQMDRSIYVVGDEQQYHFKVLKALLQKMGAPYADAVHHLSYGMVDLPTGKMKSREGTVVDADELMDEMVAQARRLSEELGKVDALSAEERERLYHIIGMGALKYHILRNDPQRRILFDPAESIDFFGVTGPFIQYAHARIHSILRKASGAARPETAAGYAPDGAEVALIRQLYRLYDVFANAVENLSPAPLAQYAYQLAHQFNAYYHDHPVLKAESEPVLHFRLLLLERVAEALRESMGLLGIEMPERM